MNYLGKHRSRFSIIADILSIVGAGALKTNIMYQANLSYSLLKRYLFELSTAKLIVKKNNMYLLTIKGKEYLDKYLLYNLNCEKLEKHAVEVKTIESELDNLVCEI